MRKAIVFGIILGLTDGAQAQSLSLADLNGVTIHTVDRFSIVARNDIGEGSGEVTIRGETTVGPGAAIRWSFIRSAAMVGAKGAKSGSISRSGSGTLGVPNQGGGKGSGVWILQGNTLVLLRVFETGGYTMRINLTKSANGFGCSVTSAMAREVGAGKTKLTAAISGGGTAQILSSKQIGVSCRATKG